MSGKMFDWIMTQVNLPSEPPPGKTLVEIMGDSRVLIENHGGVTCYNTKKINIKTSYGLLCISGCGLALAHMSKLQLVITGCVDCISLVRGNG